MREEDVLSLPHVLIDEGIPVDIDGGDHFGELLPWVGLFKLVYVFIGTL